MSERNNPNWNERWREGSTGWDIGHVSTPLAHYIDQLPDKTVRILIPGCGNAYEAEYLHTHGFTNVFVLDVAPLALESFKQRVPDFPDAHLICEDFFTHSATYHLILEQTFFCAIDPSLRDAYVAACHKMLVPGGKLVGLLWDDPMYSDHPPYGGNPAEYRQRFEPLFHIRLMEPAHNSIKPRAGREVFFIAQKG